MSGLLLVFLVSLTMSAAAAATTVGRNEERRAMLLRGALLRDEMSQEVEEEEEGAHRRLQLYSSYLHFLSHYGDTVHLYQMNTAQQQQASNGNSSNVVDDDDDDYYYKSLAQPFDEPLENGATGELIYKPYGWDLTFMFIGMGLPVGITYQLVYYPESEDPMSDMMCLGGTGTVGRLGGLYIAGKIPIASSLPKASDKNKNEWGAKIWLVPSADISSCQESIKVMSETPDYTRYMFSGKHDGLAFDYLGEP